jgi:hypothetical protein
VVIFIIDIFGHKNTTSDILQEEEEDQNQLVTTPHGHNMEDECTYNHEQVITT